MRIKSLDEFIGQLQIVGKGTLIRNAVEKDNFNDLPGTSGKRKNYSGKNNSQANRFPFLSSSLLCRQVLNRSELLFRMPKTSDSFFKKKTILFVDEIHRFNKAQQDAFLRHVENGLITLIGATTENPSFEIIPALISRCRIVTLKHLSSDDLSAVLNRALKDRKAGLGNFDLNFYKKGFRLPDNHC